MPRLILSRISCHASVKNPIGITLGAAKAVRVFAARIDVAGAVRPRQRGLGATFYAVMRQRQDRASSTLDELRPEFDLGDLDGANGAPLVRVVLRIEAGQRADVGEVHVDRDHEGTWRLPVSRVGGFRGSDTTLGNHYRIRHRGMHYSLWLRLGAGLPRRTTAAGEDDEVSDYGFDAGPTAQTDDALIEAGDQVGLVLGGPPMVVVRMRSRDRAEVAWVEQRRVMRMTFPMSALVQRSGQLCAMHAASRGAHETAISPMPLPTDDLQRLYD